MDTRKLMISITVMSLVLVLAVALFVHGQNKTRDKLESVEITGDSVFIGEWETKDHGDDDSATHVMLAFDDEGMVKGRFGKYDFSGTWKLAVDDMAIISNKNGEEVYQAKINEDHIDIASSSVTDSMRWTLYRR